VSVLGVLFAIVGGLFLETASIAAAPLVKGPLVVPIAGTVNGATETIALSGFAEIGTVFVLDGLGTEPPRVIIRFRLVNVAGVGALTGTRYIVTGETTVLRLLAVSDVLTTTFPLYPDVPGGAAKATTALATFGLSFNAVSGTLSGATAALSTAISTTTTGGGTTTKP
jgi:hypothetical protein